MKAVDLHVHSTRSDGTYTPAELVEYAIKKDLRAFALTDHDTTTGIAEAVTASANSCVEVIPGIEFSTEYNGKDIHIVGLYIPYNDPLFMERLEEFQDSRTLRNMKMCQKLQEHGVNLSYEELNVAYPDAVITRAHYSNLLIKKGYVRSMPEAFERYIGDRAPCFVPREKITPVQAIKFLQESGAVSVLAHPTLYHFGNTELNKLVRLLKDAGLAAIEAIYSTYTLGEEHAIRKLAKDYELLISGGSDFHGANKPTIDLGNGKGHLFVPESVLQQIKEFLMNNKLNSKLNNKVNSKLIFSDLDGTLFTSEHCPSAYTKKTLQKLLQKGHRFVLCSGRPLNDMLEVKENIGLNEPGQYIIAYNGAVVYDCDNESIIHNCTLPLSIVAKIFEEAKMAGLHCHTYRNNKLLTQKHTKELDYYTSLVHIDYEITDALTDTLTDEPFKVIVISLDDRSRLEAFQSRMTELFGTQIMSFFSNPYYLEFVHPNAGKGNAVSFLTNHLNMSKEDTIAFGDEANDISMLQAVGTGVAMINAIPSLKDVSAMITEQDYNHDGVAKTLEKLLML